MHKSVVVSSFEDGILEFEECTIFIFVYSFVFYKYIVNSVLVVYTSAIQCYCTVLYCTVLYQLYDTVYQ